MSITKNKDIGVEELKIKMEANENFLLIDVREVFEHQQFNIGGNLVPLNEISNHMAKILEHKDEEIILYCLSGKRSETAKQILIQSGCMNVRNVLGGVLDWIDKFGPAV